MPTGGPGSGFLFIPHRPGKRVVPLEVTSLAQAFVCAQGHVLRRAWLGTGPWLSSRLQPHGGALGNFEGRLPSLLENSLQNLS